ncbi:MAG: creatininase family protein [Tannerella sp.]|jgi:creatinine amidohydrolase|nr:creatininase family protein [Tannerella sp.]
MENFDLLSASYNGVKGVDYAYGVLPWGATEAHNYHLPYLTDCYLSHDVSVDAVRKAFALYRVRGMVLPPVTLGSQNPGQYEIAFCIHARYETQKAILSDTVACLARQGIGKLFVVNGHGGNSFKNMVRDLAFDDPSFTVIVVDWYRVVPPEGYFERAGEHADELETSVLMHYRPQLVNPAVAGDGRSRPFRSSALNRGAAWTPRNWACISQDTGVGNPHLATAAKGERYAEAVSDRLAELFGEVVTEEMYQDRFS